MAKCRGRVYPCPNENPTTQKYIGQPQGLPLQLYHRFNDMAKCRGVLHTPKINSPEKNTTHLMIWQNVGAYGIRPNEKKQCLVGNGL
jgi:hypothetical protein